MIPAPLIKKSGQRVMKREGKIKTDSARGEKKGRGRRGGREQRSLKRRPVLFIIHMSLS